MFHQSVFVYVHRLFDTERFAQGQHAEDKTDDHEGCQCGIECDRCIERLDAVLQLLECISVGLGVAVVRNRLVDVALGERAGYHDDCESETLRKVEQEMN